MEEETNRKDLRSPLTVNFMCASPWSSSSKGMDMVGDSNHTQLFCSDTQEKLYNGSALLSILFVQFSLVSRVWGKARGLLRQYSFVSFRAGIVWSVFQTVPVLSEGDHAMWDRLRCEPGEHLFIFNQHTRI